MNQERPQTEGARSLSGTPSKPAQFSSDDLLQTLVAVRGSALPPEEKTLLRDLVLEYSQEENEGEKKRLAEELARALHARKDMLVTPLSTPPPKAPERAPSSFGRTRLAPAFSSPSVKKVELSKTPVAEVPQKIQPDPAPRPEPAPPVQETVVPAHPAPPAQPTAAAPTADPKVRIAEIKRAVNERVGNPVNLVEMNPDIGREYMAALLTAIKQTSGAGGTIGPSMERLEKAYQEVTKLLESAPLPAQEPEKPKETSPIPEPMPVPPPPKPTVPEATPEVISSERESNIALREKLRAEIHIAKQEAASQNIVLEQPIPAPPPRPATPQQQAHSTQIRPLSSYEDIPRVTTKVAPVVTPPVQPINPGSVTDQLLSGGELGSPKVTAGLKQLLSEWKLFKASGFFGTGPHGHEHPLYKRIANLSMAAVIAGRFEGATPEVKRTIADYMNGWRYEHGVVHKMEEHFEHYLRRVVSHILSQQPPAQNQADSQKQE